LGKNEKKRKSTVGKKINTLSVKKFMKKRRKRCKKKVEKKNRKSERKKENVIHYGLYVKL